MTQQLSDHSPAAPTRSVRRALVAVAVALLSIGVIAPNASAQTGAPDASPYGAAGPEGGAEVSGATTVTNSGRSPGTVSASASVGTSVTFTGGGFGHGIGMSQYGARGMAARGVAAADIIRRYYQGADVAWIPQPDLRVFLAEVPGSIGTEVVASTPVAGQLTWRIPSQVIGSTGAGTPMVVTRAGGFWRISSGGSLWSMAADSAPLWLEYSSGTPVRVSATGYRYQFGRIEFSAVGADRFAIVNVDLPMQTYLYGLGEMPSSWPQAALQAQAIAARTYAFDKVARLGQNRAGCACGLYSSTVDQVYVGYEKLAGPSGSNWQAAVDATFHVVAVYGGSPIQAYFFSSSGGATENVENIWTATLPYLRGVPDPDDSFSNPVHRWTRTYSRADFSWFLFRFSDTSVGDILRVEIMNPILPSGRVGRVNSGQGGVRLVGTSRTVQISGDRLRSVINSGVAAQGGGTSRQLLSTLFTLGGFFPFGGAAVGFPTISGGDQMADGDGEVLVGSGVGVSPTLRAFSPGGQLKTAFNVGQFQFAGPVDVAGGDVIHGTFNEIAVTGGPGSAPQIQVYDYWGVLHQVINAFPSDYRGGLHVAVGNLVGDAKNEIIVSTGIGFPHVRVFDVWGNMLANFWAFPYQTPAGVEVAAGDVDGDGYDEIIVGMGPVGPPLVRVFELNGTLLAERRVWDYGNGGTHVASGDLGGDGIDEIIVGTHDGFAPIVRILGLDGVDRLPTLYPPLGGTGARVGFTTSGGRPAIAVSNAFGAASYIEVYPY